MKAEGIRRGADHVRQLTVLGDGAAWIWNLATATFPEATRVVDLFHAREHLHSLASSLEFMLLDRYEEWLAARLEDLDYGDIDGIWLPSACTPSNSVKKNEIDRALGYFLNNAPRMRYHWFRSRGLFTGSGVVEAGCKTVIGQRLKQSGMHWTVEAPTPSSPCAALRPAASGRPSAATPTTRQSRLTSPPASYPPVTYKIDVHPSRQGRGSRRYA